MNFEVNIQRVTAILVSFLCLAYRSVRYGFVFIVFTATVTSLVKSDLTQLNST